MRIFIAALTYLLLLASCSSLGTGTKASRSAGRNKDAVALNGSFEKILGDNAQTQAGLFTVHQVGSSYYFELPDSLLNREILAVTRFVKTPAGAASYGGEEISDKTIIWEKGPQNNIFLRIVTLVSEASETDAIAKAVNSSNITPILEAFEIKARNDANNSSLIDVTAFLNSENPLLALDSRQKDAFSLKSLESDKSYVKQIRSFPLNTEIRTVKTYSAKSSPDPNKGLPAGVLSGVVTMEINNSFILLPAVPMEKRPYDPRVGYFASSYYEYGDDQQKVDKNVYIHRWRLEPKDEDIEKWKAGELVEPKKPIVFYLDPATPAKWRSFLIQGINDWQQAFEQAGFKNAIVGKEWPRNNPDMSLEDSRFSVLRYFASPARNAYGPNITDPRSGEILESHIGWYHNLLNLLHNWYMIQAGAVDERAHTMQFDTELMGELVRMACAHEVGHTLGLRHNMAASYATPVEKLRDAEWLEKHGHTSSIMDYARFNYVAQPADSVAPKNLMPRIGDYDKWAIQWGYGAIPEKLTTIDKKDYLNQMIIDSVGQNPRLWFGGEGRDFDPRSQREDLGNNSMLASSYGIINLQRILPYLTQWTRSRGSDDYSSLDEVYKALVSQYENYLFHVTKNIGGIYETPRTMSEQGEVYLPVPEKVQKEALVFLDNHILKEPDWLLTNDILNKIQSPQSKEAVTKTMESVLLNLMGASRISRMMFIAERYKDIDTYTPEEYMDDLNHLVWGDLNVFYQAKTYRRNLQKSYVDNLIALYKPSEATGLVGGILAKLSEEFTSNTDVRSLALSHLIQLQRNIKNNIPVITHRMTKAHLQYLQREIDNVIGESKEPVRFIPPYNPDISIKSDGD